MPGNSPTPHSIHIRDSKNPTTAHLTLSPPTWAAFVRHSAADIKIRPA
ncbi:DUF397 domain-containing protein [Streptomyces griseosporeus]